jgi:site-specific DNA recombinase
MITMLESEQAIDNIDKLKQELLQFLSFDELTPKIFID